MKIKPLTANALMKILAARLVIASATICRILKREAFGESGEQKYNKSELALFDDASGINNHDFGEAAGGGRPHDCAGRRGESQYAASSSSIA